MSRRIHVPMVLLLALAWSLLTGMSGCATRPGDGERAEADVAPQAGDDASAAPPRVQQWMDSLTVAHRYDPQTGFIVAREVIELPPVLRNGPTLAEAVAQSGETNQLVVVFATADRCAPCQQFKKDALNDAAVVKRLKRGDLIAVHVEVDRMCDESAAILGSRMIPMTYLIHRGEVVDSLAGQRSAAAVLQWLEEAEQQG